MFGLADSADHNIFAFRNTQVYFPCFMLTCESPPNTSFYISHRKRIMASSAQKVQSGIQVILAIVIVGLVYVLYVSIIEPYARVERAKEVTEMTRQRMDDLRTAMIMYERQYDRYTTDLDSLVIWLRTDSVMMIQSDSVFGRILDLDSLAYSPRTGRAFDLSVNDTSLVNIYLLKDPDTSDFIGSLIPDVTLLNAASWE